MKLRKCPVCGQLTLGRPSGRPRLEVPVQNVLNALSGGRTVNSVALEYEISRASVYRIRDGTWAGYGESGIAITRDK